jgi:hypothetical protein
MDLLRNDPASCVSFWLEPLFTGIDEQGSVVRTGVAETDSESTTEVITAELAVELGRGRRAKTGSKRYGAEREGH